MTYKAKAILANDIVPHPEADRLRILRYGGEQFVIGMDISVGDLVVLFPTDGQLSHDFCSYNNLYRDPDKNFDKSRKGFFEDNRRVRAQPFRGQKSYGFVCTPDSLDYLGDIVLNVGDEFDSLNGQLVCSKYYTEKTLRAMKANQAKKIRDIEYTMREHIDTEKWSYTKPDALEEKSLVIITEKVHGTSARTSYTEVIRRNGGFLSRLISFFTGKSTDKKSYEYVSGTRRTIVNNRLDVTVDGEQDFYRWEWHNRIAPQLHMGETVYYEIVGYDSHGGTIMEKQDLKKVKTLPIKDSWRNPMVYSYGLPEGENDVYVYRITMTSADGTITELSWSQVEQRCRELGLKNVPPMFKGFINHVSDIDEIVKINLDDSSSSLDHRHLMEGVCIRIENSYGVRIFKEKNFLFGVLEGYLKESSDYVDAEEAN